MIEVTVVVTVADNPVDEVSTTLVELLRKNIVDVVVVNDVTILTPGDEILVDSRSGVVASVAMICDSGTGLDFDELAANEYELDTAVVELKLAANELELDVNGSTVRRVSDLSALATPGKPSSTKKRDTVERE